jgi:hypothetical protein
LFKEKRASGENMGKASMLFSRRERYFSAGFANYLRGVALRNNGYACLEEGEKSFNV